MFFRGQLLVFLLFLHQGNCQTGQHDEDILHQFMTPSELEYYFGSSANDRDYVVTHPALSSASGEIISDELSPSKLHDTKNFGETYRVFFLLDAFGTKLLLNVSKNENILGPAFAIETRHCNGTTSVSTPDPADHYIGNVISNPGSTVALTSTKGNALQGMIKLKEEVFFVHPLPSHLRKRRKRSLGPNPHLVVREMAQKTSYPVQAGHSNSLDTENDIEYRNAFKYRRSTTEVQTTNGTLPYKYMQTIFVVDQYLNEFLGRSTLSNILPTLANIIAGIFLDESFGEINIHYVLNKIIFLELPYSSSATTRAKLDAVDAWIDANYPKGHVDVATLLARGEPGGRGYINSICSRETPTSNVVAFSGLNSAPQIAHETGHNIGVPHDGGKDKCPNMKHIMATSVPPGPAAFTWSLCSKDSVQTFLQAEASSCLDDPPITNNIQKLPNSVTPGVIYDADKQCELQHGTSYKHCSRLGGPCQSLYCSQDSTTCITFFLPPLDGTRCGVRLWCIKGVCVDDGSPVIDGVWGEWSAEYSPCTRTCGGGVQHKIRKCDTPRPQNGGADCEGSDYGQYRLCNIQSCPEGEISFRQQQCSEKGAGYTEYLLDTEPCSLVCRYGSNIYWLGKAKGGTKCYNDKNILDVCVDGHCKEVGCDYVLLSGKTFDRCRECGGDGSSCALYTVNYTKNYKRYGFGKPDTMVTVPAQSTNVVAIQRNAGFNTLGVQTTEGEYIFSLPTWSTSVEFAGSTISYIHEDNQFRDRIYIDGPTTFPINLVFVFLYASNKGTDITYYSPSATNQTTDYIWVVTEWSECSRTCAVGFKNRDVKCVRSDDNTDSAAENCLESAKPDALVKCNTQKCPPEWYTTPWQPCSLSCGKGTQVRTVTCREKLYENQWLTLANESLCSEPKPEITPLERACNQVDCPPVYVPLEWSKCSTTCGAGVIIRGLQCVRKTYVGTTELLPDYWCEEYGAIKLPTTENCNMDSPCQLPTPIACFDLDTVVFSTVLANFQETLDYNNILPTVKACAELAHVQNYQYFGLANNGECRVGPNARKNFYKAPLSSSCTSFVGNANSIFVYSSDALRLLRLGCYKDRFSDRAMPFFIKNFRDQIDWYDLSKTVNQCAHTVYNAGYRYFGVQFYGECWTSANAKSTYDIYGTSENCVETVGGDWANMVYTFV